MADIRVSSVGLGSARQPARLWRMDGGWGNSKSRVIGEGSPGSVFRIIDLERLATVASAFSPAGRLVIKIDTEGSEGPILGGSLDWIIERRPYLIVAPHERLYPNPLLPTVIRTLRHVYRHVVTEKGAPLCWPDEGPEPSLILFSDDEPPE